MKIVSKIILCYLFVLLFSFCGEEEEDNVLPVEPVNLRINLRVDNVLKTQGNYKEYIKGKHPILAGEYLGYGGILVVRSIFEEEIPFWAYDLSCPHEKSPAIRVVPSNTDGIVATCEKCGRVYDLMNGGEILSELSNLHLQRYRVSGALDPEIFYITR